MMPPILRVQNLNVTYRSTGKLALNDLSFSLGGGESLAILGPSGCGKTTLLEAIAGILQRKEAQIKGEIFKEKIRTALVFQSPNLLPWRNVSKNIALGLEIKKIPHEIIEKKVAKIISLVGLSDFSSYYPHQLSSGMRQRVNFARALVMEPEILLLDEPFSALDIETKEEILREFIQIIRKNKISSILVTHNIKEAQDFAQRILVLSKSPGKVRFEFSAEKIIDVQKIDFFAEIED